MIFISSNYCAYSFRSVADFVAIFKIPNTNAVICCRYLRCPHLDTNPCAPEYHPFTISSAHGDLIHKDFVSCHIKIIPGGWTERLKNYFEDMNPGQDYPFHLKHIDEKGERQDGKLIGIDGQQLLCVDGPHSSPSQHYDAYRRCMVVGAGIGMTPCASILRFVATLANTPL